MVVLCYQQAFYRLANISLLSKKAKLVLHKKTHVIPFEESNMRSLWREDKDWRSDRKGFWLLINVVTRHSRTCFGTVCWLETRSYQVGVSAADVLAC